VHVTLPESLYDRAYAAAAEERISIPELIRQALKSNLETQNRKT
jgi:predicted HicB family RNase H-like nuclease